MIATWPELKACALALDLPKVEQTTSWGNPCLKAHGKLWCWWSPYVDAALFKCPIDEREMLRHADPDTFLHHDHYAKHGLILVAAGRIGEDWARARLIRNWREAAPKRFLKDWDAKTQQRDQTPIWPEIPATRRPRVVTSNTRARWNRLTFHAIFSCSKIPRAGPSLMDGGRAANPAWPLVQTQTGLRSRPYGKATHLGPVMG